MDNQDNQYDVTYRIIEIMKRLTKQEITPMVAAEAISKEVEQYANFKAEKMYSEEDLREAFKQSRQAEIFEKNMPPVYESFEEWFEQFKKK
jgi:hypothetical protein